MTSPVLQGEFFLEEVIKRSYRYGKNFLGGVRRPFFGGHYAVTRSLVEGLAKRNLPFVHNPINHRRVTPLVVVLAGEKTLRQAIGLKKNGDINYIAAGPNISVFSSDYDSLLANDAIDLILVPSEWVARMYLEDHSELNSKIFVWPAGVDPNIWRPAYYRPKGRVLIYDKLIRYNRSVIKNVQYVLTQYGLSVSVLEYGKYSRQEYLNELQRAELMIGFSDSESQGIAWAEAWSADVPTFIFKNESSVYLGRTYRCSTAPYLCSDNGIFFDDIHEFTDLFQRWRFGSLKFAPRNWVLRNMTDELCAEKLYNRVTNC